VTVVDYGIGNLLSVCRALEHCGASVQLTAEPSSVGKADRLVLPGVGAFADGMAGLTAGGFIGPIRSFAERGKPFLGICLGMQMMLDVSEEFGTHEGLGLIPGKVVAIPATGADGRPHKIPHIGWNGIIPHTPQGDWKGTILEGLEIGTSVYFVHSYVSTPSSANDRLADCDYDGRLLAAVIRSGPLYGCQFHPEKSGEAGLRILRNFLRM
jgi:glutamine amidotransferase